MKGRFTILSVAAFFAAGGAMAHMALSGPEWSAPRLIALSGQVSEAPQNPSGVPQRIGADWKGPVIYASVYYNSTENPEDYGMYAIDGATGRMERVPMDMQLIANGSGYYEDGVYYCTSQPEESYTVNAYAFDVETWKLLDSTVLPDYSTLALDEAYDPTTGNVYGCFCDETGIRFYFGYIDHKNHTRVAIADVGDVLYFGVIATPEGEIYAMASDGMLYRIDKLTGERTRIGSLGIRPKYNQTAVCDLQTGKVYWLGCDTNGAAGLFDVNLETGKATLIRNFTKREGMVGAFIAQEAWAPSVADAPSGLTVDFPDASLSGKVTFTMPSATLEGKSISSAMDYTLLADGRPVASGSAKPGEKVSADLSLEEGLHPIVASAIYDGKHGKIARVEEYVGYDAPAEVTGLGIDVTDRTTVSLKWNVPSEGVNGGYLDPSDISYRIIRYPGSTLVSSGYKKNEFTQKVSAKDYHAYRYEITSMSHKKQGGTMTTGYVATGSPYELPYTQALTDAKTADLFVSHGEGWSYDSSRSAFVFTGADATGNALVTPYITLRGDCAYEVRLTPAATEEGTPASKGTVKIMAGLGLDKEALDKEGFSAVRFDGQGYPESGYIYTGADGDWHIALSALTGGQEADGLTVAEIMVAEGPSAKAPRMVENLVVKPGAKGTLTSTVTCDAPVLAIDGSKLSSLARVSLYYGNRKVATVENPAPGASISFTDENAPEGEAVYEVRAENASGEGVPVRGSAFVGEDIPLAPMNVRLIDNGNTMRLTWDAPVVGVNGAYLDPDAITYTVIRNDNSVAAKDITGNLFDDVRSYTGSQSFLQYAVMATNLKGQSGYSMSNTIVCGTPYTVPFEEGFPGGGLNYPFWSQSYAGASYFRLSGDEGADGQPGCATYQASTAGGYGALESGKITLGGTTHPACSYWYKAVPGANTTVTVTAILPDESHVVMDEVDFTALTGSDGWRKRNFSLEDLKGNRFVRLSFAVMSLDGKTGSSVDEIYVVDAAAKDLSIAMDAPSRLTTGEPTGVMVRINNEGYEAAPAGSYEVKLYKDGNVAATAAGLELKPFESRDYTLDIVSDLFDSAGVVLKGEVAASSDPVQDNNVTAERKVKVVQPGFPIPRHLEGTFSSDRTASIAWQAPDDAEFRMASVTDDAEEYGMFIIDNIGDWTVYDGDEAQTLGIANASGSYHAFPHALDPKAFIVFNAPESGVEYLDQFGLPTKWTPHSGDQMFVAFQASSAVADDWLVSPRLSGKEQTVRFFCKGVSEVNNGLESYEVLYSTTGTAPEDFIPVIIDGLAGDDWTEVSADLPEGALYFAIHYNSVGHFALMVDDVTYSPEDFSDLKLLGYNVYRDHKLVNASPLSALDFSETLAADGAAYHVTALYDRGESLPTEALLLGNAGVSGAYASGFGVSVSGHVITVSGAAGQHGGIYAADGRAVYSADSLPGEIGVTVETGVYMVSVGGRCVKVIVK
ncbi:MAG: hypothetical protein HDR80_05555 [Bacteroides sp.]|nr:hypothetical protein [Bacteroides sp.]